MIITAIKKFCANKDKFEWKIEFMVRGWLRKLIA